MSLVEWAALENIALRAKVQELQDALDASSRRIGELHALLSGFGSANEILRGRLARLEARPQADGDQGDEP